MAVVNSLVCSESLVHLPTNQAGVGINFKKFASLTFKDGAECLISKITVSDIAKKKHAEQA